MFGLRHKVIDASDAPDFDAFFDAADQPSIDGLNTYIVAGVAAREGFRVALSGVGADELFAGYTTFRRIPMLSAFNTMRSGQCRAPRPQSGRRKPVQSTGPRRCRALLRLAACRTQVGVRRGSGGIADRRHCNSTLDRQLLAPPNGPSESIGIGDLPRVHASAGRGCVRDGPLPRAENAVCGSLGAGCRPVNPGHPPFCNRQADDRSSAGSAPTRGPRPRSEAGLRVAVQGVVGRRPTTAGRSPSQRAAGRRLGRRAA